MRDMLIRTHMQDLRETTHDMHYENYRATQLAKVGRKRERERERERGRRNKVIENVCVCICAVDVYSH